MQTNTILKITGILVLIGLAIVFKPKKEETETKNPKSKSGKPLNVKGIVITAEELKTDLMASGSLIANQEVELNAESSGKAVTVNITEGALVSKGTLLVKLNDAELKAQLKKLEANKIIIEEREKRQKKLLDINAISKEEYESISNQISSIQADIELVQAQISKTEIRAPFTGVIGLKYITEGSYVNNSTKIASIQQLNPIKIDFSLPEKYVGKVKNGSNIVFNVASSSKKFSGKVYAIEPKIDANSRSLILRALANNSSSELIPGSFCSIELNLKSESHAIMIPTEAVIPDLKSQKVYISENGKAKPVNVITGLRTDTKIQILEGLQEGDTLITSGIMQLKPESPIKVKIK